MSNKIRKELLAKALTCGGALLLLCLTSSAQQTPQSATSPDQKAKSVQQTATATPKQAVPFVSPNPFATSTDDHYTIGPGDVLDIRIVNRPNLSREAVRVEGNGAIRMPLIETEIQAACLTESELEKEIASQYVKYYPHLSVSVFIKEYRSTQVAVLGFVNEQGRFQLQRRIRLLELLTYAKGPSDHAGQTINVIHSVTAFQCRPEGKKGEVETGLASFRLSDTLRGDDRANPYLENGDIVTLPEADQIYVVGNVLQPRSILLKEPITLTMAIAMAGGLSKDTKQDKIRVVRQEPGSTVKQEIFVDLAAIEKKKAEDIALRPNDIVDVPISGTKSIMRSLIVGMGSTATQLPLRVVP